MSTSPPKKHFTYTIKDFYHEYKGEKKNEGKNLNQIISYKIYRNLVEDFFLEIYRKIIYENFTFMMPYSLGSVFVKTFKNNVKNLRVDWSKSREVGKIVKYLNLHTFGYSFGTTWNKSCINFRNKAYYLFCATSSKKATRVGIGKKGLSKYVTQLSKDPQKRSYIKI